MTRKSGTATDSRQLRADVEQAREELADTVAELAGKADVKAHAREMAAHAKSKALFEVNEAKARVQHTAEEAANRGFTRPGAAMAALGGLGVAALAVYLVLQRQRAAAGSHWKQWLIRASQPNWTKLTHRRHWMHGGPRLRKHAMCKNLYGKR